MNLPSQSSTRTHSISMTRSTSLSGEHQEDLTAQGAQAGQEDQMILTGDHTDHLFPPHTSFPSNLPETSDWPGCLPYFSMETEPELTPLSESFGFI